jgi:hypothetical protein
MLRPERSIDSSHAELNQHYRRTSHGNNNSIDEITESGLPYTSTVSSPERNYNNEHHGLPKTVVGPGSVKHQNNARTTVNFFRSVHNNSGSIPFQNNTASRDSGRGLGGGWNGGVIEESPQKDKEGKTVTDIPGLTYL